MTGLIEAQLRAEEEQATPQSLRAIQRAFREALLALLPEAYDWFDIRSRTRGEGGPRPFGTEVGGADGEAAELGATERSLRPGTQRQFFEYAGPLFSVVISPPSSTTPVNERRRFRALPPDRSRRRVEQDPQFFGRSPRVAARSQVPRTRRPNFWRPRLRGFHRSRSPSSSATSLLPPKRWSP